jgi:tetratricopeptide (TPR) repeat protein
MLNLSVMQNPIKNKYPVMKTIFLTLLLFSISIAFSQSNLSDSAAIFFRQGLEKKKDRLHLEALRNFEKAFKYDSTNKNILAEMADSYYELRRYNQSMELYKKLEQMGAAGEETYKKLLSLSSNFRKYDDMIRYAKKVKEINPSEKTSYYIGKAYYEQENYGEALKYLDFAEKEDPANAEVPYMIARSYADMMNYKQSVSFFEKAIRLDTTKYGWMYELSLIYYAMNDSKNSLKYIIMAGDKGYKKDNDYMENLATAYINAGKPDEAINILTDLLKKKPSDINILNTLAETFYEKKKYQEAIDYWDQILSFDKSNASALYMIGMSYQKKGEKEKGMQLCDKAIEMDPSLGSLRQKQMTMGL